MADLHNQQPVIGVRLLSEGATLYNNCPVIGVRAATGLVFTDNQIVRGVEVIDDDRPLYNGQPVVGAVMIDDDRDLYNLQLVVPVEGLTPPFDPSIFFANGEQGGLYDPSDLTTLFQDAAGTVPVTADGDPVGRINDKSGNGNHLTQSATSARPTYRTDGTRHWLEPDGVDDYLVAANYPAPLSQPITHAFAYRRLGTPERPTLFDGAGTNRNTLIIQTGRFEAYAGSGANIASISSTANTDYIGRMVFNGASSAAAQNGATPVAFSPGTQGLQGYRLFVRSDATLQFPGRYYGGLVINRALTPDEATKLDAWLAAKAGVTL